MNFYVMEKFCHLIFFILIPTDLKTTLTYVPMDNFCPFLPLKPLNHKPKEG